MSEVSRYLWQSEHVESRELELIEAEVKCGFHSLLDVVCRTGQSAPLKDVKLGPADVWRRVF